MRSPGVLERVVDRTGHVWAELAWSGDRLVQLCVPGAITVIVHGEIVSDPLLGDAHVIEAGDHTTTMTALDWARPAAIPALAAPARLPPHAGGVILNVIAMLARGPLRYAGPYPTPALWRALARSFRTAASELAFTAGALDRMLRLARDPIPIDFDPAPHERVAIPRGFVELRDGLERAVIDQIAYEPHGSPARLVDGRAELWFGDIRHAHVATLAATGELLDGPAAIPPVTTDALGKQFPQALVGALAELVADAVPAPLAADARRWLATRVIRWTDLGARVARITPEGLEVHAAIWQYVAPHGLGRVALALAEALAPVVTAAVLAAVAGATVATSTPEPS